MFYRGTGIEDTSHPVLSVLFRKPLSLAMEWSHLSLVTLHISLGWKKGASFFYLSVCVYALYMSCVCAICACMYMHIYMHMYMHIYSTVYVCYVWQMLCVYIYVCYLLCM